MYKPPFHITTKILNLTNQIQEILGELKVYDRNSKPFLKLRKENRIKTIKFSLAIEGNTLTEEQITAIIDHQKVVGPKNEIIEVQNAIKLYDSIEDLNPLKEKDFLKAHKVLMDQLISSNGRYRNHGVGIFKGPVVNKIAPPHRLVPELMGKLFDFLSNDKEFSFLLKSCIAHYEIEFIHPFEDGNGRIGRLWQQLLLLKHMDLFGNISIETLTFKLQKNYYKALELSDKQGNSTPFVEFSLQVILKSLQEYLGLMVLSKLTETDRLEKALEFFKSREFSRKDYIQFHKTISTATASRDLIQGREQGLIVASGKNALTRYQKA